MLGFHLKVLRLLTHPYTKEAAPFGALRAGGLGAGVGATIGTGVAAARGDSLGSGAVAGGTIGGLGAMGLRHSGNTILREGVDRRMLDAARAATSRAGRPAGDARELLRSPARHSSEVVSKSVRDATWGLMDQDLLRAFEAAERDRIGLQTRGSARDLAHHLANAR